jgi:hypothetical protein
VDLRFVHPFPLPQQPTTPLCRQNDAPRRIESEIDGDKPRDSCSIGPPTLMKEVAPMQNSHLSALEAKHNVLDRQITAESQRPAPDTRILANLKKQKLRVKEAIAAI